MQGQHLRSTEAYRLELRKDVSGGIQIASVPHPLVSSPERVYETLPFRKAIEAVSDFLLDETVARLNNPRFAVHRRSPQRPNAQAQRTEPQVDSHPNSLAKPMRQAISTE
ncbi:MAG: hypothetical protein WCJ40_16260 [Planctomycetota bacterium]